MNRYGLVVKRKMRAHNWHPKIIEDYLTKYYKNEKSRKTVRVYLKVFFDINNKDPKKWIKQSQKTIHDDLWDFAKKIENKPNKTQSAIFNIVKKFLERHDIEFKTKQWEELRQRNNLKRNVRPIVKKATPTQTDLKKILNYATNIKTKAYFVLLASSGIRRDEGLKLTWDDIDFENRMIRLSEEVAKDGIARFTFFSEEAKELLVLWKPEREKQLASLHRKSTVLRNNLEKRGYEIKKDVRKSTFKAANGIEYHHAYWEVWKDGRKLSHDEVVKLDTRIFPFEAENFEKIWIRMLEKTGEPYNQKDNNPRLQYARYLYNIHSLRRFWFTQLRSDRMNDEYYNYIGGHTSLLDRTYGDWLDDVTMQQTIKKEYDEHMGALSIFETTSKDIDDLNKRLQEQDAKIKELKMEILELRITKQEQLNAK